MPKGIYERIYRHAPNFRDISGQRFGKRIVLSWNSSPIYRGKKGSSLWNVICDCGKESVIATSTLKITTSCGCDNDKAAKRSGQTRSSGIPRGIQHNHSHRRTHFKLSPDDFQKRIEEQENKCKVCRETFIRTPHIDHDHACCSGKKSCGKCIRGLLCSNCNCGLGNFHDDIDRLEKAITYLKNKGI